MKHINQEFYKNKCRYSLDNEPNGFGVKTFKTNSIDNNLFYVKTEYLEEFFRLYKPNEPYTLFSGRSDKNITSEYKYILDDPSLTLWYSVNVDYIHSKLKSIPLGLMDSWWYTDSYSEYGNNDLILDFQNVYKTNDVYMNFNISNNISDRQFCADVASKLGIENKGNGLNTKSYSTYLMELSSSRFCLCPNGNGIDTHRFWESIYVKTIPVVTNSINISFYKDLPMIVLNTWNDLINEKLTEERYQSIMDKFND